MYCDLGFLSKVGYEDKRKRKDERMGDREENYMKI